MILLHAPEHFVADVICVTQTDLTRLGEHASYSRYFENVQSCAFWGTWQLKHCFTESVAIWSRINALAGQSRPVFGRPMHVLAFANLQQQIEFIGEECVMVLQSKAKEREGFDGRSPAHDHFGASVRQEIDRGEILKDPHRIGSAQDGDGAGQANALRSGSRGAENDCGSGVQELPTVVFTDAKRIQTDLIGVLDLLDQIAQTLLWTHRATAVVKGGREAVNTYLHQHVLESPTQCFPQEAAARARTPDDLPELSHEP
jgi:hypothetical protein